MEMRRSDLQITDLNAIEDILKQAKIVHLGLSDGGVPYVVPLHYGYLLENGTLTLYMHGAYSGRKYELAAKNCAAFAEIDTGATLLSGGEDPCHYSAAYRSVMGPGRASIVTDGAEKMKALALLMRNQAGRDFAFTPEMANTVCVFKVVLDSFTAKSKQAPDTLGEKETKRPFVDMNNHELFCVLAGDYGVIAQTQLHRVLNKYRAKHHKLDSDLNAMVTEILLEDK